MTSRFSCISKRVPEYSHEIIVLLTKTVMDRRMKYIAETVMWAIF